MKQPNWKVPLILSGTLLAVGGLTYWLQYSHKPKQEKLDSAQKKPLALPSDNTQIAMFKIKSQSGLIEAKCNELAQKKCTFDSEASWTVSHPASYPADSENIKAFLNSATQVIATEVIDLGEETTEKRAQLLKEYGLGPEQRTDIKTQFIELVLENGKRITAWFGEEHPLGDKTFVVRSDDGNLDDKKIYLITNFFKSNFDKQLTHFREKKLFHFDRAQIQSFEAKTTSSKLSAVENNGKWTINGLPADDDRIETVLSAISQLKAIEFHEDSILKGLKPIVTYQLKEKDKTHRLDLYVKVLKTTRELPRYEEDHHDHHDHDGHDHGRDPSSTANGKVNNVREEKHYYATSSELKQPVEVSAIIRSQIDQSLTDLRFANLIASADKVSITKLSLSGKSYAKPAEFEKKNGVWTSESGLSVENPPKLLDIFAKSRASDFIRAPKIPQAPSVKVTLGSDQNPNQYQYEFILASAAKNETVYAIDLNSKTNEAMILDAAIFKNAVPFNPDSWKIK